VDDEADLQELTAQVLRRTGAGDVTAAAGTRAWSLLEPDLDAVLRLRLGLDRDPVQPRTRRQVAVAMGLGGARIEEAIAAIEEDAVEALGPAAAG
jgi:hypothetical protein